MMLDIDCDRTEPVILVNRNDGSCTVSVSHIAFERAARQYFQNSAAIERSVTSENIAANGSLQ
jgi:hypothetical protein